MLQPAEDNPQMTPFAFTLVPVHKPEELHENMRSSIARNLPRVQMCSANDDILSVAGGGPSLEDTYKDLTGYVAAINGSLSFLLDRDILPHMCGVCDPSPHMVDIVETDRRVTYFLASIVHPTVYDKLLNAGCRVFRWNSSSVPGGERVLATYEPDSLTIGGGSTMGLRWITLGYSMGFRKFHLHGLDSSFRMHDVRGKASHAYKDHQDEKDWITFDGYQTRVNFIGQLSDFMGWLERLKDDDVDPVELKVFGEGLLQFRYRQWKELNPHWHNGPPKPPSEGPTAGFRWPVRDQMAKPAALAGVRDIEKFMAFIKRRGTVVQAGGNVGAYPAYLARHFQHVLTFEPDHTNYTLMADNLAGAKGNIRTFNAALGDRDGTCGVFMPDPANTGAIVTTEAGDVPMRRIDDLELPECDLIWLDVEGYELNALRGAEDTVFEFSPAIIVEELDVTEKQRAASQAVVDWLHEHGYVFAARYGNDKLFLPSC